MEVRKDYEIKSSNSFAVLEILSDNEDINIACENIQYNIQTSAKNSLYLYQSKQHKPWLDEECSRFFGQS